VSPRRTIDELLGDARGGLDRLGPDEALAAIRAGALVVDIRSERQRERDGVVPGAVFHPRNALEWRADPASGHDDPALSADLTRRLIVMCDEGCQSSLAAATLQALGFARATDLDGGFQAWRAAGLPVEPLAGSAPVRTAHTADLDPDTLAAVRALVARVFGSQFSEEDWDHGLGGIHVLAHDGDRLIGHACVVQRRLLHGGRALRTGYVEGVVVDAGHRRQGHAGAMMDAVERVIRGAYDIGALSATEAGVRLYEARGWTRWSGPTSVLTPDGVVPTEDTSVHVLPVAVTLDPTGPLTCDWRPGDPW
jgi:aminoglycoside 2'-N-acetyltransferase I